MGCIGLNIFVKLDIIWIRIRGGKNNIRLIRIIRIMGRSRRYHNKITWKILYKILTINIRQKLLNKIYNCLRLNPRKVYYDTKIKEWYMIYF